MKIIKATEAGSIRTREWSPEVTKTTVTTPVASVDFDNIFTSDYDCYEFVFSDIAPSVDGADLYITLRDATPADATGTYRSSGRYDRVEASSGGYLYEATQRMIDNVGSGTNEFTSFVMTIFPNTPTWKNWFWKCYRQASGTARVHQHGGGLLENTAAMAGVKFSFNSGNIESGSISWRGVA